MTRPSVDRASDSASRDLSMAKFAALAFAIPLVALGLHHDLGHHGDIGFFRDWYLAFRESNAFYRDGPGLNYPIVGVLLVCLPATIVDALLGTRLTLDDFRVVHKFVLVAGEIGLAFALAPLSRVVGAQRPRLVAIAIVLLPCTWAPGAWFGQIDVWGTLFLILATTQLIHYRYLGTSKPLVLALLAIAAAILTKQLTWFTLPSLGLLTIAALWKHRTRRVHWALVAAAPLLLLLPDAFVELPAGYHSHLWWVVAGGGSAHGDFIVAGGASLWSLIADIDVSAHEWKLWGVRAYVWGMLLFAGAHALAFYGVVRARFRVHALIWHAGATNLAMAVLLTGVHERYLVHGAPFLLLALAGRFRLFATAVLAWWGLFVLGSIHFDAFEGVLTPFRMHETIAVLLLALLAAVYVSLFRAPTHARGARS